MSKGKAKQLVELFNEMDPAARQLGLKICRVYKRRSDIRAQTRVRDEFGRFLEELKRAEQALLLVERDLVRLDMRIRVSLGDLTGRWCRMIRRATVCSVRSYIGGNSRLVTYTDCAGIILAYKSKSTRFCFLMNATQHGWHLEKLHFSHHRLTRCKARFKPF